MRARPIAAIVCLCLLLAAQAAAKDIDLVRRQTKLAIGSAALDGLKSLRFEFELRQAGLKGTGVSIFDFQTGRTVTRFELGPLSGAEGFDGTRAWMQDWAGIITIPAGGERPKQIISTKFRQLLGFWYPSRAGPADLKLRTQLFQQRLYDAVTVSPRGGLTFEMWFDAETKLLARTIEEGASETRTIIYEDYRPLGGLLLARRIRYSNASASFGSERLVTKIVINPEIKADDFAIPNPPKADFVFTAKSPAKIKFKSLNNHIYMDVQLNGQSYTLLLDTGASNVITPTLARNLGLRVTGDATITGTGETSAQAGFTRVRKVDLGPVTLRDQVFAVVKLEDLSAVEGIPFHGLLGYEVFKRLGVGIDYDKRELTLSNHNEIPVEPSGIAVPFVFNGTIPEVIAEIDGIPASFNVDTGSRTSIGINTPFVLLHGLRARFRPQVEAVTGWGLGGPTRGTVARTPQFKIAGIRLGDVIVDMSLQREGMLAHAVPAGSIGGGLLKRFRVIFDYARQRMILVPRDDTHKREAYDRAGLWINRSAQGLTIIHVVPGSPASEAGLREGDVIAAIDGVPANALPLSDTRNRLRQLPPGTELQLRLLSGRRLKLKLRDLI